jgi:hypothetical protein
MLLLLPLDVPRIFFIFIQLLAVRHSNAAAAAVRSLIAFCELMTLASVD